METEIRPYAAADREILRALVHRPELAPQFDIFIGPHALEQRMSDPRLPASGIRLAFEAGEPVGFGFAFVLPSPFGDWASPRVGVVATRRRRGIGRRLLAAAVEAIARGAPALRLVELSSTAWVPDPPVEAFAEAVGYHHDR